MDSFRCFNVMIIALFCLSLGCTPMSAWQMQRVAGQGAWPEGPDKAPSHPGNLDSGLQTPFSLLNPDHEMWVATYGDDKNPGTLFKPKRTIAAAVLLAAPGTAIMVKAGKYSEYLNFPVSGQPNKPIWLRSADGKGAAEISTAWAGEAPVQIIGVSNIIVEGFKLAGGVVIREVGTTIPTNIVIQNNIIMNALVDGIASRYAQNVFFIANEIYGAPRGNGIQILQNRSVKVVDNYIHDLRTNGTKNDGVNIKGDTRDVLLLNNIIERIDGTGMVLEGLNVMARANSIAGFRRAVSFTGCSSCSLERNNLKVSGGVLSDVALQVGDSPAFPTINISITNNCVHRPEWLYVESGAGTGLVNQSNTATACQ